MDENGNRNDFMEMYQIAQVLAEDHGFFQQLINQYMHLLDRELWLTNAQDPDYQIIRITQNSPKEFDQDRERVVQIVNYYETLSGKPMKFLDIHVCRDEYSDDDEEFDHIHIHDHFFAGPDLRNIYPRIYEAIDPTADVNLVLNRFSDQLAKIKKKQDASLPFWKRHPFLVTDSLIALCVIVYLLGLLLMREHDKVPVYIFLGADYGTFTLGLRQFWRLVSCAFVHDGLIHLACNMYSLYFVGHYMEKMIGRRFYVLCLLVCVLTASLTQDILSENTVTLGISGGIYGMMVVFIADLIRRKFASIRSFFPLIAVNLLINFFDHTAWIAHLGGLVAGSVMYFLLIEKNKRGPMILTGVMVACLLVKYYSAKVISPFYGGTDLAVVRIISDLGFRGYAQKLLLALQDVYRNFGG